MEAIIQVASVVEPNDVNQWQVAVELRPADVHIQPAAVYIEQSDLLKFEVPRLNDDRLGVGRDARGG